LWFNKKEKKNLILHSLEWKAIRMEVTVPLVFNLIWNDIPHPPSGDDHVFRFPHIVTWFAIDSKDMRKVTPSLEPSQ
jgi:hypothetical protein